MQDSVIATCWTDFPRYVTGATRDAVQANPANRAQLSRRMTTSSAMRQSGIGLSESGTQGGAAGAAFGRCDLHRLIDALGRVGIDETLGRI